MRNITVLALALVGAGFCTSQAAAEIPIATLHAFCAKSDCADGIESRAPLTADGAGNFYGTTTGGGSHHGGTVFRLHFDGSHWTFKSVHSFCANPDCTDGYFPEGGVTVAADGTLYGLTSAGGATNHGVLYRLAPDGARWRYSVLHDFCAKANCADGADPLYTTLAYQGQSTGALYDGTSPLYGVAHAGGVKNEGVAFSFVPNAGHGTYGVIYDFCRRTNCVDGAEPSMGVTVDAMGRLYGTALGGAMHVGVLYQLAFDGSKWVDTALYGFCSDFDGTVCHDGMNPAAPPLIDATGNLYGTTAGDGEHDKGTIYKLVPNGTHSKLTVLHSFCGAPHCTDGETPLSGIVMDGTALYGTTLQGGFHDGGTLFRLGGNKFSTFETLVTFRARQGAVPFGALALAPDMLVGTLSAGGHNSGGTAFAITP